MKHTPKPWTAGPLRDYQVTSDGEGATPFECIDIESPTGSICMVTTDQVGQVEAIANADLITAAPDLLEAFEASLARAYAAGHQRGHEDTVEGIFTEVWREDASTYFADDIREMMSNNCLPEAKAAIDKATGAARP